MFQLKSFRILSLPSSSFSKWNQSSWNFPPYWLQTYTQTWPRFTFYSWWGIVTVTLHVSRECILVFFMGFGWGLRRRKCFNWKALECPRYHRVAFQREIKAYEISHQIDCKHTHEHDHNSHSIADEVSSQWHCMSVGNAF
jgi:hypothetical protein